MAKVTDFQFIGRGFESSFKNFFANYMKKIFLGHPFAKDASTFKKWIDQLWFQHYSRACGMPDTSGFEHVFMGEVRQGEGKTTDLCFMARFQVRMS